MNRKRISKILLVIVGIFFLLFLLGKSTHAVGLIDETINKANNYSKYKIENYQLDYFVDSTWDWLPWNWGAGIGKSVVYGIYAITNLLWLLGVMISYATGYLVGEAYSLDFISSMTKAIGKNIQILAGINEKGIMRTGFFPGFLLLLVLVMGIYVAYTGLIKRETTKAISALVSFVSIFLLSASFIAYSTSYISRINEFSSDISQSALDLGSKMTISDTTAKDKSSVDAIRDSLFEIQVKKPWMILQFGDSDIEAIGKDRVETLESTNPFTNFGKDRTEIVKKEITEKENDNLTITKTVNRLGVTIFIFFFNLLISVFVFILTGTMIFSQILFIIFAIFLPVSFLLSMIPSFNHLMKKTIMRLFNVVMMRAGITLVLTLAFSLSAMVYGLTSSQPFFIIAFMQIVIFGGIYFKLNDLMGMMALSSADSQSVGNHVTRKPKQTINRALRRVAVQGLAIKGISSVTKNRKKTPESPSKDDPKKKSQRKQASTNKSDKSLPKETDQKKAAKEKKKDQTKKQTTLSQQEKVKQEAARKFKQTQHKKNRSKPENEEKEQKEQKNQQTQESKRRKATTRELAKPQQKSTPTKPKNKDARNDPKREPNPLNPKDTPPKKKGTKKQPEIAPTKRIPVADKKQKTLEKGKAIERTISNEKPTTAKKDIKKDKETKNSLNGKGSKRR